MRLLAHGEELGWGGAAAETVAVAAPAVAADAAGPAALTLDWPAALAGAALAPVAGVAASPGGTLAVDAGGALSLAPGAAFALLPLGETAIASGVLAYVLDGRVGLVRVRASVSGRLQYPVSWDARDDAAWAADLSIFTGDDQTPSGVPAARIPGRTVERLGSGEHRRARFADAAGRIVAVESAWGVEWMLRVEDRAGAPWLVAEHRGAMRGELALPGGWTRIAGSVSAGSSVLRLTAQDGAGVWTGVEVALSGVTPALVTGTVMADAYRVTPAQFQTLSENFGFAALARVEFSGAVNLLDWAVIPLGAPPDMAALRLMASQRTAAASGSPARATVALDAALAAVGGLAAGRWVEPTPPISARTGLTAHAADPIEQITGAAWVAAGGQAVLAGPAGAETLQLVAPAAGVQALLLSGVTRRGVPFTLQMDPTALQARDVFVGAQPEAILPMLNSSDAGRSPRPRHLFDAAGLRQWETEGAVAPLPYAVGGRGARITAGAASHRVRYDLDVTAGVPVRLSGGVRTPGGPTGATQVRISVRGNEVAENSIAGSGTWSATGAFSAGGTTLPGTFENGGWVDLGGGEYLAELLFTPNASRRVEVTIGSGQGASGAGNERILDVLCGAPALAAPTTPVSPLAETGWEAV